MLGEMKQRPGRLAAEGIRVIQDKHHHQQHTLWLIKMMMVKRALIGPAATRTGPPRATKDLRVAYSIEVSQVRLMRLQDRCTPALLSSPQARFARQSFIHTLYYYIYPHIKSIERSALRIAMVSTRRAG